MAKMKLLEGTGLVINLDQVITAQKGIANKSKKACILFNMSDQKEVLWEFGDDNDCKEAFDALTDSEA